MGRKLDAVNCNCDKCVNYEICKYVEVTKKHLGIMEDAFCEESSMIELTITCPRFINTDFSRR